MTIDRNNYEALVLDYLEGTISPQDRSELFVFLDKNPDLKSALDVNVDLVLPSAKMIGNFDKTLLKKHIAEEFELEPKDYLFIKQKEIGLNADEQKELALLEPSETKRLKIAALFAKTSLKAGEDIVYKNKASLKRFLTFTNLSKYRFNQIAAVIAVLLLASIIWLLPNKIAKDSTTLISEVSKLDENNEIEIAEAKPKIFEKTIITKKAPSKDSLLKIANDPMGKKDAKPKALIKREDTILTVENEPVEMLAAIATVSLNKNTSINAYEHGLNVMMPQYMSNNILRRELAEIYRRLDDEKINPPKNLALVENGVKVLNFFSKDALSLNKYYDNDGNVVGYHLEGSGLELKRKAR